MNNFRNFQFARVLRVVFALVFVAVLASCPMPDIGMGAHTDTDKPPAPPPPTAVAGGDQLDITELDMVTLSASESTAASDDIPIRTYLWTQDSGQVLS